MAITINQHVAMTAFGSSASTALTFPSAMINPSLILALVTLEPGASAPSITSISDNKNAGNYTQDVSVKNSSGNSSGEGLTAIFSMQNTQTAAAQVTMALSAANHGTLAIYELLGAATSAAFDKSATDFNNGTGGSPNLVLSGLAANDAIFSVLTCYPTPTATTDSGFTALGPVVSGFSNKNYGEYDLAYAPGGALTLTYGGLGGALTAYSTVAAAYKAAGAGPTGGTPFLPFSRTQFFVEDRVIQF